MNTHRIGTVATDTFKITQSVFVEYGKLIIAAVAVLFFGVSRLNIEWQTKKWIFIILGALLAVSIVGVCVIFFRKYQRVAVVTDFLLLLLIVCLSSVGPALLLGREFQILLLKIGAILFFSLLPGLLYLQFIVVKGKTLREEYVLNLFRLHIDDYATLPEPPRASIFHACWSSSWKRRGQSPKPSATRDNLYLRKFEGLYGAAITRTLLDSSTNDEPVPIRPEGGGRFRGENLLPVISTTLLLSVCWALVLQPEAVFNWTRLPSTFALNNKPLIPGEALRFGFVGAYFFILQMLVRRYFQDDLKTSAYINALNRIILVILLVTALNIVWPASWPVQQQYAFAFLIGIFPQIGVRAIQSLVTIPLRYLIPSLKTDYPLSDLDGLNIWYESRLLEESIEDMQNLAKANLVDVILRTRIPVDRLVDWIDQAHLYLHIPKANRSELRRRGIRAATGLERFVKNQKQHEALPVEHNGDNGQPSEEMAKLNKEAEENKPGNARLTLSELESIANILANEPNLYHVREWKAFAYLLDQLEKKSEPMSSIPKLLHKAPVSLPEPAPASLPGVE
jgi:hypothetical protein